MVKSLRYKNNKLCKKTFKQNLMMGTDVIKGLKNIWKSTAVFLCRFKVRIYFPRFISQLASKIINQLSLWQWPNVLTSLSFVFTERVSEHKSFHFDKWKPSSNIFSAWPNKRDVVSKVSIMQHSTYLLINYQEKIPT